MQVKNPNKIKYKQNTLTYAQMEKYNFFFLPVSILHH